MAVPRKTLDRKDIVKLLGVEPGAVKIADAKQVGSEIFGSGRSAKLVFTTADGASIPAILLHPIEAKKPGPAILYCHAHGARYDIGIDELHNGRPALVGPYANDLMALGYTVLCMEMPCFGSRADIQENAAAKAALWLGQTLFGQMLSELTAGIDYLQSLPQVDEKRIATMGISMGGTHAWWLGALDERIKAVVHMCCFADLECLIKTGAHEGHGNYMTVPRLLQHSSTGALAGLIAPRHQLVCVGLKDWSTPAGCFDLARKQLEAAYLEVCAKDRLAFHIEPEHGHEETWEMRGKIIDFLKCSL